MNNGTPLPRVEETTSTAGNSNKPFLVSTIPGGIHDSGPTKTRMSSHNRMAITVKTLYKDFLKKGRETVQEKLFYTTLYGMAV